MKRHPPEQDKLTFFKYMPVSPEAVKWGAYVLNAGYTDVKPNSPYPPYQHPSDHDFTWEKGRALSHCQILYIAQGGGVFESARSEPVAIHAGDAFVMFPGVWHRFKPDPETGWKEYWLEFSGDYLNGLLKNRIFREDKPVLKIGVDVELIQLYESIFELIRREPADYHLLLGSKAVYFIAYLISTQKKRKMAGRSAEDIIAEAKTMLLDQSNTQKVDLQQVAVKLNLSFTVFRRLFKVYTGFSPRQFALQATVMKAKVLLGNTSKPVGMVAEELGFGSVYYFSRFFLKKTGMTPTDFRRRRPVAQPDETP